MRIVKTVRSISSLRTARVSTVYIKDCDVFQDCKDCEDCKEALHCKDGEPADNDGFVICFSSVFLFCSIAPPGN